MNNQRSSLSRQNLEQLISPCRDPNPPQHVRHLGSLTCSCTCLSQGFINLPHPSRMHRLGVIFVFSCLKAHLMKGACKVREAAWYMQAGHLERSAAVWHHESGRRDGFCEKFILLAAGCPQRSALAEEHVILRAPGLCPRSPVEEAERSIHAQAGVCAER
jgi:hypothetical protein